MTAHHATVIAHRMEQLKALAQVRQTLPHGDGQTVQELFDRDSANLNDKDFEMILTLTMRYLTRVRS